MDMAKVAKMKSKLHSLYLEERSRLGSAKKVQFPALVAQVLNDFNIHGDARLAYHSELCRRSGQKGGSAPRRKGCSPRESGYGVGKDNHTRWLMENDPERLRQIARDKGID
jgi:hypothetical protein